MKKILFIFLFPFYLFGEFTNLIDNSEASSCLCTSGGWTVTAFNDITVTRRSDTGARNSSCSDNSNKSDWELMEVISTNPTYNKYTYVVRSSSYSCEPCSDGKESINSECVDTCLVDEVRNEEGECVAPIPVCEDGKILDNDEVCRDSCGVDGLIIDGLCEEQASCNDGYSLSYDISEENDCNFNSSSDVEDSYRLFPNTAEPSSTCCVKSVSDSSDSETSSDSSDSETSSDPSDSETSSDSSDSETSSDSSDSETSSVDLTETNNLITDANEKLDNLTTEERATQEVIKNVTSQLQSNSITRTREAVINHQDFVSLENASNVNSQNEIAHANANANQAHEDSLASDSENQNNADRNHDDLTDIKDALGADNEFLDDAESYGNDLNSIQGTLENSLALIESGFSSMILDILSLDKLPQFVAHGKTSFEFSVFGGTVVLDFSIVKNLKPFFDIVFLLILAFINFKLYSYVFMALVNKA